jgi:hypothetical protein
MYWAVLLHTSTIRHSGDFLGAPRRRLLWFTPFVFLLHPVPYLIVGFLVVSVMALLGTISRTWLWFVGGAYVYLLFMGTFVASTLRRRRKRSNKEPKPVP